MCKGRMNGFLTSLLRMRTQAKHIVIELFLSHPEVEIHIVIFETRFWIQRTSIHTFSSHFVVIEITHDIFQYL